MFFFCVIESYTFGLPPLSFWRHHQDFFSSIQASSRPGSLALSWRSTSPVPFEQKPEPAPGGTADIIPFIKMEGFIVDRRGAGGHLTIMGNTIAAGDVLITQSNTRQVSWVMVNRCTFLKGT